MSKQKSAVEQFAEQLASKNLLGIYTYDEMVMFDDLLNQFKEIEKEQIINSVVWFDDTDRRPCEIEKDAEQYYNETYGGNK
jgi:hypothetical protein